LLFARRLAIEIVCLLVGLVRLLAFVVAGLASLAAGLAMGVIAIAILAFVAADERCSRGARRQACAGASWSAAPGATHTR
jgi:hypothetical protein